MSDFFALNKRYRCLRNKQLYNLGITDDERREFAELDLKLHGENGLLHSVGECLAQSADWFRRLLVREMASRRS